MASSNDADEDNDDDVDEEAPAAAPLFNEEAYAAVADVELEDLGSDDSEPDEAFIEAKSATGRKAKAKAKAKAAKAEATAVARAEKQQGPIARPATQDQIEGAASDSDAEDLQSFQNRQERVEALKQQMAVASSQLLQNPHDHLKNLHALLSLVRDADLEIARLAMLSLQSVFADILPEYTIRLPTAKELGAPVSKEVKAIRDFETTLLHQSEAYVKLLLKVVRGLDSEDSSKIAMALVALHCMNNLLAARTTFNFSSQLLQSIVPVMVHRHTEAAKAARASIRRIIAADTGGDVTLQAVQLIADVVKRADCRCDPEVIRCLFGIEFRDAKLPDKASKKSGKAQKKKQKKIQRGITGEILNVFAEADATAASKAAIERKSLTLEALFEVTFRIIKTAAAKGGTKGGKARQKGRDRTVMLGAALECVRKLCHLISLDYFTDLTAVLLELLQGGRLSSVDRLQCLITGIHLSRIQAGELVDQLPFFDHLIQMIDSAAISPLLFDSGRGFSAAAALQLQEVARGPLLLEAAQAMFSGHVTPLTAWRTHVAVKALTLAAAAASDSGTAMGLLALTGQLIGRHAGQLASHLEHEACTPAGSKAHETQQDIYAASASAEVLWELAAMGRHYHPHVAATATTTASSGRPLTGSAPTVVAEYSVATGCFKPPPQRPQSGNVKSRASTRKTLGTITARGGLLLSMAADVEANGMEDSLAAQQALMQYFKSISRGGHMPKLREQQQAHLLSLQLDEFQRERHLDFAEPMQTEAA